MEGGARKAVVCRGEGAVAGEERVRRHPRGGWSVAAAFALRARHRQESVQRTLQIQADGEAVHQRAYDAHSPIDGRPSPSSVHPIALPRRI